jgi:hypothetical protein
LGNKDGTPSAPGHQSLLEYDVRQDATDIGNYVLYFFQVSRNSGAEGIVNSCRHLRLAMVMMMMMMTIFIIYIYVYINFIWEVGKVFIYDMT